MKAAITELSSTDAEVYQRFLKPAEQIHSLTAKIFTFIPIHEFKKLTLKDFSDCKGEMDNELARCRSYYHLP